MRLPNGMGSVYKLSGNRRKPWAARKTTGWRTVQGKQRAYPVYDFVGYYATRREAMTALVEYNRDPYDLNATKITFAEVYDRWSARKYSETSQSSVKSYRAAYVICAPLHDMRFVDIKLDHLQTVADNSGKNAPTLKKWKSLLNQMYEYAIRHEIVTPDKNMTKYVDTKRAGNPNALDRKPFTRAEIKKLWDCKDANTYMSIVLMLIYTGTRIGELLALKKEDVHLDNRWFFVRQSKTESGVRAVPISDKIMPFFRSWMDTADCEYLLSTPSGKKFDYRSYYDYYWTPLMLALNMDHRPHDTRHTCVSLLTIAGVSDKIIKKIIGHKGQSVTEIVYTHFGISDLLDAINKI